MSHSAAEGRLAALQRHLSVGLNLSDGAYACRCQSFTAMLIYHHALVQKRHVMLQVWSYITLRVQACSVLLLEGVLEV